VTASRTGEQSNLLINLNKRDITMTEVIDAEVTEVVEAAPEAQPEQETFKRVKIDFTKVQTIEDIKMVIDALGISWAADDSPEMISHLTEEFDAIMVQG